MPLRKDSLAFPIGRFSFSWKVGSWYLRSGSTQCMISLSFFAQCSISSFRSRNIRQKSTVFLLALDQMLVLKSQTQRLLDVSTLIRPLEHSSNTRMAPSLVRRPLISLWVFFMSWILSVIILSFSLFSPFSDEESTSLSPPPPSSSSEMCRLRRGAWRSACRGDDVAMTWR